MCVRGGGGRRRAGVKSEGASLWGKWAARRCPLFLCFSSFLPFLCFPVLLISCCYPRCFLCLSSLVCFLFFSSLRCCCSLPVLAAVLRPPLCWGREGGGGRLAHAAVVARACLMQPRVLQENPDDFDSGPLHLLTQSVKENSQVRGYCSFPPSVALASRRPARTGAAGVADAWARRRC